MEQIKIDLVPNGVMSVAHASQFDVGRSIKFLLTDEGVTYTLAGTEVITMKLRKPDGTDDTISLVNTSSSYVEWTTVDGDLDLSGVYLAEITITSGDDVLGTMNFLLKVEPDAFDGKNLRIVTVGPSDICTFETDLAEPLISVKSAIVATQSGSGTPYPAGGGKNKLPDSFEQGAISSNTGADYDTCKTPSATRIRTQGLINTNNQTFTISIKTGYLYVVQCFDADGNLYVDSFSNQWKSEPTTFTNTPFIAVAIKKSNEGNITPSELSSAECQLELGSSATPYAPYSNVRPINGYTGLNLTACGVNLWDEEWELGGYSTSTGNPIAYTDRIRSKNAIKVFPNTEYCIRCGFTNPMIVNAYDENGTFIEPLVASSVSSSGKTFTTTNNTSYLKFATDSAYGTTYNNDISILYPSDTTPTYHAYTGTVYPVSWQDEAGTVYGGELDLTTGVLTVTYRKIENIRADSKNGTFSTNDYSVFTLAGTRPSDGVRATNDNDTDTTFICDNFKSTNIGKALFAAQREVGIAAAEGSGVCYLCVEKSFADTLEDINTWFTNNPTTICANLITPLTYNLTPVQVRAIVSGGQPTQNNVFADTGDTEVKYLTEE